MSIEASADWLLAVLLLSLRLAPTFAFAPPFSMLQAPARVRVFLAIGIAACMAGRVSGNVSAGAPGTVLVAACAELVIGAVFALSLLAAFSAFYFAGRVLDIQAGFGLSLVIDPASSTQSPLFGTILAMAAGWVFFAMGGHHDLLRLIALSLDTLPLGQGFPSLEPERFIAYFGTVIAMGLAAVSIAMTTLFLLDVAIAFLSRSMPQMNMLVLGFQIKTLAILLVMAASIGLTAPIMMRILRYSLESSAEMLHP